MLPRVFVNHKIFVRESQQQLGASRRRVRPGTSSVYASFYIWSGIVRMCELIPRQWYEYIIFIFSFFKYYVRLLVHL